MLSVNMAVEKLLLLKKARDGVNKLDNVKAMQAAMEDDFMMAEDK